MGQNDNGLMSALVLDGDSRIALGLVRALGRKGVKVIVGGPKKRSRAFFSRYCSASFVYPVDPGGEKMSACVLQNVEHYRPTVLFPVLNKTFFMAMREAKRYRQHTRLIPLPDPKAFSLVDNKSRMLGLARELGISAPATWLPENSQEAEMIVRKQGGVFILKPMVTAGGFGAQMITSFGQVKAAYMRMKDLEGTCMPDVFFDVTKPLLQEFVSGPVVTFFAYSEKGVLTRIFTTETLRNHPVPFGPGVCVRSIRNEDVIAFSRKLLEHLQWDGIVGLQYVIDRRDGMPKLIDANPRFWGILDSAVHAGVDFPYLLFRKACGHAVDVDLSYSEGIKFRWLLCGEILRVFQAEDKWGSLKAFVSDAGVPNEVQWSDMMPHMVQLMNVLLLRQDMR